MKHVHALNRSLVQVKPPVSAARSAVAIAITPQRTNVSIPNKADALVTTGLLLLGVGLFMAAIDE